MKNKIIIVLVLIIIGLIIHSCNQPTLIGTAVYDGKVRVTMTTSGDSSESGGSMQVTLTRLASSSGRLVVRVPIGTIFNPGDEHVQYMMAAEDLILSLAPGQDSTSGNCHTWCLDQFSDNPNTGTTYTYSSSAHYTDRTGNYKNPNETAEFAKKLAKINLPNQEKQHLIWSVSEGYLNLTYQQALQLITSKLQATLQTQFADRRSKWKATFKQNHPDADDEDIEQALSDVETTTGPRLILQTAETNAKAYLHKLIDEAKQDLAQCDSDIPHQLLDDVSNNHIQY